MPYRALSEQDDAFRRYYNNITMLNTQRKNSLTMKKYGIFYGSATGTTADVASRIGALLGVDAKDIINVKDADPVQFGDYEVLILGTSTWGDGELEEDWYDLLTGVEVLALHGKKIAVFGCGDENMADTFCNGVGELYSRLQRTGATFIAPFNTDGYTYHKTTAEVDGKVIGLLLDEVNKPELTPAKISAWTELIKNS